MKKNLSCFILLLAVSVVFLTSIVWGEKAAVLPEITNPYTITAANDKLYITEPLTVYIYSLADYRLIKKFGQEGSGKGEFKGIITLHSGPDYIFIESKNKISFFTPAGDLINEQKKPSAEQGRVFHIPIGNRFVVGEYREEYQANFFSRFFAAVLYESGVPASGFYITLSTYNANLVKVKDIFTYKHPFFTGKYIDPVDIRGSLCRVYGDRLFIDDREGVIHVFAANGNYLYPIHPDYEKVPITQTQRRRYLKYWMEHEAGAYAHYQGRLRFPEYFPPIRNFFVDSTFASGGSEPFWKRVPTPPKTFYQKLLQGVQGDGFLEKSPPGRRRLYILTFKEIEGKSELLILDLEGRWLKKVLVPLTGIDSLRPMAMNRYTINNGKLYQLVRNKERQYDLHIMPLELGSQSPANPARVRDNEVKE